MFASASQFHTLYYVCLFVVCCFTFSLSLSCSLFFNLSVVTHLSSPFHPLFTFVSLHVLNCVKCPNLLLNINLECFTSALHTLVFPSEKADLVVQLGPYIQWQRQKPHIGPGVSETQVHASLITLLWCHTGLMYVCGRHFISFCFQKSSEKYFWLCLYSNYILTSVRG